uniref:Sulfate transporter sulfate bicarbonate oxalate exchanger sat-1 n=1 Tax=Candidozyma auris TaxID=498019 RepID=A0A0L0NU14_CANAR
MSTPEVPYELGRSYVSVNLRNLVSQKLPTVLSGSEVHRQTADLASIGVVGDEQEENETFDEYSSEHQPIPIERSSDFKLKETIWEDKAAHLPDTQVLPDEADSTTPLVDKHKKFYVDEESFGEAGPAFGSLGPDASWSGRLEQGPQLEGVPHVAAKTPLRKQLLRPIQYLPAVFLGVLLNVLDGLSYGMIMFPIGEALFADMAPAGLSMFYISTVVSQLVYSLGGSAFKAGIGSEMIEVTPFFHAMAYAIQTDMKTNYPDIKSDAIIATTFVSFAVSAVVTGVVFFLLGKLRLGLLVGFFPRHILVGCIGGVGYFLIVTGIEVSSRLEGGIKYDWETAQLLFGNYLTLLQWLLPVLLTVILIFLHKRIHHSLLVPVFFIIVFVVFHVVVVLVTNWDLDMARHYGWVFPAVENHEPWYSHYSYLKPSLIDWVAIAKQFPKMLALTFFGILHVPINVPALAVTVGMDQFDVDRELVAHGYSNAISGLVGSVQNYLVYTNSVLFIRAGADDRLAGILLAVATACVMMIGPVVIGYIPVCVVGSLIFLLGYELLKEAIYDTWGRLRKIEYSTIIIIVVVMGAWDFVYGILAGILLACLLFVVEAARRPVVRGIYTGVVARSTVLRHPKQQEFLKDVGNQICVVKLQGTLFFGSIGGVEKTIRARFENGKFTLSPIKFLIIDMKGVDSIDFSAAEGFRRILNLTNEFQTQLIISSVEENDDSVVALRDAGLWENHKGSEPSLQVQMFSSLNYALEWCENSFLKTYTKLQGSSISGSQKMSLRGVPSSNNFNKRHHSMSKLVMPNYPINFGTPRTKQIYQAAKKTANDEQKVQSRYYLTSDSSFKKQPLPLIMITFGELSNKDEKFWSMLAPYFTKETIPADMCFYDTNCKRPSFFLLEAGLVRQICKFESDDRELHSSILPNTAFGDLLELSQYRQVTYTTVVETVAWRLSEKKVKELIKTSEGQAVYSELLQVQTKLFKERFDSLTANLMISA